MSRSFKRLRSVLYVLLPTLAFAFLFTVAARPAEAATLTVCAVGCDHTTIEDAHIAAAVGDTILISTTVHTEGVNITKDLTIIGLGANATYLQAAGSRGVATSRVLTITASTNITISNMTIRWGNEPSLYGGGLLIETGAVVNLQNVVITENDSNFGGAIHNDGTLTTTGSYIVNNFASVEGGGIYNNGLLDIANSALTNNTALNAGGAIRNQPTGDVYITNSTISTNTVTAVGSAGGAISNDNNVTIRFSTFYHNQSAFSGNTFANVSAGRTTTVTNSIIVASPPPAHSFTCNFTGNMVGTANLSTNIDGCGFTFGSIGAPTGIIALANNGGATPTHALGASSNAIDAAIGCPASGTDQRGAARDDLVCDIGAFELVFTDSNTVSRSTGNTPAELPGSFGPTLVNITVVNGGDPGTVTITKTAQPPGGSLDANEMPVTWDISATGFPYNVNVEFCYTDAELGSLIEANLQAYRWNEVNSEWDLVGGAVDVNANCVTVTSIEEFSAWTLATAVPTAVTLSSTTAASNATSFPWLLLSLLALLTAVVVQRQFSPTVPARVQNK